MFAEEVWWQLWWRIALLIRAAASGTSPCSHATQCTSLHTYVAAVDSRLAMEGSLRPCISAF